MRNYKNCLEAIKNVARDLAVRGITYNAKTVQNRLLEDTEFKELIAVQFSILDIRDKRDDMLDYIFKDKNEALNIKRYIYQECYERFEDLDINPGKSYLYREEFWKQYLNNEGKFDYTYNERLHLNSQWIKAIETLKLDKGNRQAIISIWNPSEDINYTNGIKRVPCSIYYHIIIRDDKVHLIYRMRSSDLVNHLPIDLYLATLTLEKALVDLRTRYPELKAGYLFFSSDCLHVLHEDIKKFNLF